MKIRRAMKKDIPEINSLLYQVCMVHHIGRPDLFRAGAKKYNDEELEAILENEETPVFAAVDENDKMLGYAFCIFQRHPGTGAFTKIDTLYIDDLCVDENMRGKHVGKAIYEEVLRFAKESGCHNVTLNVWTCNESAMKFYESCGLKPQKIGMEVVL